MSLHKNSKNSENVVKSVVNGGRGDNREGGGDKDDKLGIFF